MLVIITVEIIRVKIMYIPKISLALSPQYALVTVEQQNYFYIRIKWLDKTFQICLKYKFKYKIFISFKIKL